MGSSASLLLKWSLRDLRRRWVLVTAIALVIALGTGIFAALESMLAWRQASNDASFAALAMHDLQVELGTGQFVDQGTIADAVREAVPGGVGEVQERLLVPTQVDASGAGGTILVSGELVGMQVPTSVDRVHVFEGEGLDAGAVLDVNFARFHELPSEGQLRVRGGRPLPYVGIGTAPEYVYITGGEQGGLFAHAQYAVAFAPLATAQALTGHEGQVNDAVVTLPPGTEAAAVAPALERALGDALPASVAVTTRDDDPVYTTLYEDIANDQKVMTIMAVLVLAGAAFATFNLTSRIVESERRQIGIAMALGAPPRRIAVRPLLVGLEIAVIGAVAGLGLGYLAAGALAGVLEDFVPLPIWVTEITPGAFLEAMALGMAMPVLATIVPVWRAVRVAPVDAIRPAHLAAQSPALTRLGRHLRVPGRRSWQDMPFRNILRAPRRTLLTALGIGAAITSLVAILGMLDTFLGAVDDSTQELTRTADDRMVVTLDTFVPLESPVVTAVADEATIGRSEPGLQVSGSLDGDDEVGLVIELLDLDGAMWTPTVTTSAPTTGPGLVLPRKAAEDVGAEVGDRVALAHPVFDPATGAVTTTTTDVAVAGIHPGAFRFQAYMDLDAATVFGLTGLTNRVVVQPATGVDQAQVQRALFGQPGVAGVQAVGESARALEGLLDQFVGIFRVVELVVLLLAVLIAFNSSSLAVDERAREHATMFAFGLPVRHVLSMVTIESLLTGLLGTAVGLAVGYGVLAWIVATLLPNTIPEVGMVASIDPATIGAAALFGVVAVAVAPLFTVRRLRRMDVPSTLRVVE